VSTSSWVQAIAERRRIARQGYAPRARVLQSDIPNDATVSVDRQDPEVFGPLYLRQKSEMTVSNNSAEIISKEYVDAFSAGVGRLNESLRQPYQLSRWYSSSHGQRRSASTWADGDCVMSLIYVGLTSSITVDALRYEVTTAVAASTARVGLYTVDFNTLLPTALLVDGGTGSTAAVAKVTVTLSTPQVLTSPGWYGLAIAMQGGAVAFSCDKLGGSVNMQTPYGWSALPFTTATNAKYGLLVAATGGSLPSAGSFTSATTVNYGSGLWLRRSV